MSKNWTFVAAIMLGLGASPAYASTYRTQASGGSELELVMNERDFAYTDCVLSGRLGGNRDVVHGELIVSRAFHVSSHERIIKGDFSLWVRGKKDPCRGTVSMRRDTSVSPAVLEMALKFDDNAACSSLEPHAGELFLVESLPRSDEKGRYSRWNSDTYLSHGEVEVTWPRWKVTTDRLKCLESPNHPDAQVVTFLQRDDLVWASWSPSSTSFHHLDENRLEVETPMERGGQSCYVRAHRRNIEPVSIPEEERFFLNGLIACPDAFDLIPVKRIVDERGRVINRLSRGYVCSERDGDRVLGPFTAKMVDRCLFWGGGESCMERTWNKKVAAGLYGEGDCPQGAFRDPDTKYCVEGGEALGPFPKALSAKCAEHGGGRQCGESRWDRFLLSELLEGFCNYDAECPYGQACQKSACVEAACHGEDPRRGIAGKTCHRDEVCVYPDEWSARQGLGECVP